MHQIENAVRCLSFSIAFVCIVGCSLFDRSGDYRVRELRRSIGYDILDASFTSTGAVESITIMDPDMWTTEQGVGFGSGGHLFVQ